MVNATNNAPITKSAIGLRSVPPVCLRGVRGLSRRIKHRQMNQYVSYRRESEEENSAPVGAAWFLGNRGLAPSVIWAINQSVDKD
jgi:hypothetical protein